MSSRQPYSCLLPASLAGWRQPARNCSIFLGLGLVATAPFWQMSTAVVAQPLIQIANDAPAPSQLSRLYVNPNSGDDQSGNGTEATPFKTITQALRVAQPNTVITLTPGTYSRETGEVFPLKLKPGITLQGNPSTKGRNIVIRGGGGFLSRTFAGQDVTITGANQATITGVTITNPNPRGYGLWIESNSPVVENNTFTGNSHDGISVAGTCTSLIRNNDFYKNGGNGITIYGTAKPEVRENLFQNTGFGISVGHNAAPLLIGNRVSGNKDGVVVETNAQPVLRNNVIENNTRFGLVAISQARPDLGTAGEPGNNIFRGNGELDINAQASRQLISAYGNQLSARTVGRIQLGGMATKISAVPEALPQWQTDGTVQPVAQRGNSASSAGLFDPNYDNTPDPLAQTASTRNSGRKPATPVSTRVTKPSTTATAVPSTRPTAGRTLPTPPTPSTYQRPAPFKTTTVPVLQPAPAIPPVPSGSVTPEVGRSIEFSAEDTGTQTPLPISNPTPLGNPGSLPGRQFGGSPQPQGLRFRVLVEAKNSAEESRVQSLVPNAFRIVSNGRGVMQVGAFSSRDRAEEMQQMLRSNGLQATIEEL